MNTQVDVASKARTLTGTLSYFDEEMAKWLITMGPGEPLAVLSETCRKESGALEASEGAQIIFEVSEEGSHVVSRVVSITPPKS